MWIKFIIIESIIDCAMDYYSIAVLVVARCVEWMVHSSSRRIE